MGKTRYVSLSQAAVIRQKLFTLSSYTCVGTCKKQVKGRDSVVCDICQGHSHAPCARFRSCAVASRDTTNDNKWVCQGCAPSSPQLHWPEPQVRRRPNLSPTSQSLQLLHESEAPYIRHDQTRVHRICSSRLQLKSQFRDLGTTHKYSPVLSPPAFDGASPTHTFNKSISKVFLRFWFPGNWSSPWGS
jgi:hypothetical protein